jgi:hypothetical protein
MTAIRMNATKGALALFDLRRPRGRRAGTHSTPRATNLQFSALTFCS